MRLSTPSSAWSGAKQKAGPPASASVRTCFSCGVKAEGGELLRFVCGASGVLLLDRTGRMPGRGVYSCCDMLCLRNMLKAKKLGPAFRKELAVPDGETVYDEVRALLYKRLGACLGLGQKAGDIVSGHASLQKAFLQARVFYLIVAEDVAVRRAEEYRAWCIQYAVPYVTLFTKEKLGDMLGKPSRSAVGLTSARFLGILGAILASLERLQTTHGALETQASFS